MLSIYWGCLITGILLTLITIVFDDLIGNAFDGVMDALSVDAAGAFQSTVIVSMLTIFGGAGVLLTEYTSLAAVIVLILSVALAIVLGIAVYFLYVKPMENTENSTGFSNVDFVGKFAEVSIAIPAGGFGEVMVKMGASNTNQIAASFDHVDILAGVQVVVVKVEDHVLYVTAYE